MSYSFSTEVSFYFILITLVHNFVDDLRFLSCLWLKSTAKDRSHTNATSSSLPAKFVSSHEIVIVGFFVNFGRSFDFGGASCNGITSNAEDAISSLIVFRLLLQQVLLSLLLKPRNIKLFLFVSSSIIK